MAKTMLEMNGVLEMTQKWTARQWELSLGHLAITRAADQQGQDTINRQ